jgi:hypothetical protein
MLDYLLCLTDTSQSSEDMDAHGVQKSWGGYKRFLYGYFGGSKWLQTNFRVQPLGGHYIFIHNFQKNLPPPPPQSPVFIYILIFCNDHDSAFSSRIIENPNEIGTEESFPTISLLSDRKKIVMQ